RQIAMYLIKALTGASLPEIGKAFGGKHHSTVIHSVRKIDTLRKRDPEFDRRINSFVQVFRGGCLGFPPRGRGAPGARWLGPGCFHVRTGHEAQPSTSARTGDAPAAEGLGTVFAV